MGPATAPAVIYARNILGRACVWCKMQCSAVIHGEIHRTTRVRVQIVHRNGAGRPNDRTTRTRNFPASLFYIYVTAK